MKTYFKHISLLIAFFGLNATSYAQNEFEAQEKCAYFYMYASSVYHYSLASDNSTGVLNSKAKLSKSPVFDNYLKAFKNATILAKSLSTKAITLNNDTLYDKAAEVFDSSNPNDVLAFNATCEKLVEDEFKNWTDADKAWFNKTYSRKSFLDVTWKSF